MSVGFDVTRVEQGITTEQERQEQCRELTGSEKPEFPTRDEKYNKIFPPTAIAWTTIASKQMSEISQDVTGRLPAEEEEEYICQAEKGDTEIQCLEGQGGTDNNVEIPVDAHEDEFKTEWHM